MAVNFQLPQQQQSLKQTSHHIITMDDINDYADHHASTYQEEDAPPQTILTSDISCASSVTTRHFHNAELFGPSMYPSLQEEEEEELPSIVSSLMEASADNSKKVIHPKPNATVAAAATASVTTTTTTAPGSLCLLEDGILKQSKTKLTAVPTNGPHSAAAPKKKTMASKGAANLKTTSDQEQDQHQPLSLTATASAGSTSQPGAFAVTPTVSTPETTPPIDDDNPTMSNDDSPSPGCVDDSGDKEDDDRVNDDNDIEQQPLEVSGLAEAKPVKEEDSTTAIPQQATPFEEKNAMFKDKSRKILTRIGIVGIILVLGGVILVGAWCGSRFGSSNRGNGASLIDEDNTVASTTTYDRDPLHTLNGNAFTDEFVPDALCALKFSRDDIWSLVADCTPDAGTGIPLMECPRTCCTSCCDPKTGICKGT